MVFLFVCFFLTVKLCRQINSEKREKLLPRGFNIYKENNRKATNLLQQEAKKSKKTITCGMVNSNYVKINLKKNDIRGRKKSTSTLGCKRLNWKRKHL